MRILKASAIALSVAFAAGCTGDLGADPEEPPVAPGALVVRTIEWNPSKVNVGKVAAVTEDRGTLVVFGDTGATVLSGGIITATDAAVNDWQAATLIPAGDGNGTWIAGVDGKGRILRLRAATYFEDVSDIYGLADEPILAVAPLGGAFIGFALEGELAITDGTTVTHYEAGSYPELAGGKGRAAGVIDGDVFVFDAAKAQAIHYTVEGAEQAVIDANGKLVVRTRDALYAEDDLGGLVLRYESASGDMHALVTSGTLTSGSRVWFADGATLGTFEDGAVSLTPSAVPLDNARLVGSPSGDVWVLREGELTRFAAERPDAQSRRAWEDTVQPLFLRSCTPCHAPGGSGGADLSTYDEWDARRAALKERVVEKKTMPPTGIEFTDADRKVIADWLAVSAP